MNDALWIVVPAAGYGERMGSDIPKQYLHIGGQCILQHTLSRLLAVPDVQGVVVVLAKDDTHWSGVGAGRDARVHTVQGGITRTESVVSGLQYVKERSAKDTWVLVHDAARALIDVSDIQRLTNAVFNSGAIGGILATPVQDTLKRADEYHCIENTVSREQLWQAQTPQLFRVDELLSAIQVTRNAIEKPEADEALASGDLAQQSPATVVRLTDEASAMESQGYEPLLVEALQPNFKITRPVDLVVADALLRTSVAQS